MSEKYFSTLHVPATDEDGVDVAAWPRAHDPDVGQEVLVAVGHEHAVPCAYLSATDGDAGMYLFASAGPVELIIRGDVSQYSVVGRAGSVFRANGFRRRGRA